MWNKCIHMRSAIFLIAFFLNGCTSSSGSGSMTFTPSPVRPTATPTETQQPTVTPTLSPTPLPGFIVLPIEALGKSVPWLSLNETVPPRVSYVGFNTNKLPFNYALVRQAFAYAIDRDIMVEVARQYGTMNATPATTLVPPETLGRDLYGEVGLAFDPKKARDLLTQAGYIDSSSFPAVEFFVNTTDSNFPNKRTSLAIAMADMWKTYLGVNVYVYTFSSGYYDQIAKNSPALFWVDWEASYNDPDDFLRTLFYTGSEYNYGGFLNSKFNNLVDRAVRNNNPADRQAMYIEAERLLCETEAALIPLYHR